MRLNYARARERWHRLRFHGRLLGGATTLASRWSRGDADESGIKATADYIRGFLGVIDRGDGRSNTSSSRRQGKSTRSSSGRILINRNAVESKLDRMKNRILAAISVPQLTAGVLT